MGVDAPLRGRGARLSFEEWAGLPEDEPGEWADGYLVEEEMPGVLHELVVAFLTAALRAALGGRGVVLGSGVKYKVSGRRGRLPDASVFLGERRLPPTGAVMVPPDIAIEVVTPTPRDGRRDRVEKLGEYAAFGIQSYWIVDPALRTLEILVLDEHRRYAHAADAVEGVVAVPGQPGLAIDLDALWREVDALTGGGDSAGGENP